MTRTQSTAHVQVPVRSAHPYPGRGANAASSSATGIGDVNIVPVHELISAERDLAQALRRYQGVTGRMGLVPNWMQVVQRHVHAQRDVAQGPGPTDSGSGSGSTSGSTSGNGSGNGSGSTSTATTARSRTPVVTSLPARHAV
ncbi:hypothetical protein OC835_007881 [Tilletia horrida]|nr:hypothetical protein OC835_007881 [Tilletia horrida]